MNKLTLFSGIQPSGELTLGNYISILKEFSKIQNKFNSFLCIADLHSISKYNNPILLKKNILDTLSYIIACGIDVNNSIVFKQSDIYYHTQLYWILLSLININKLTKLNQFKEKKKNNDNVNCSLLTYPVLMASDIILYNTDIVLIGNDQVQHIEIINSIIKKFNKIYGNYIKNIKPLINKNKYIMSLLDINKKMSKSNINKNNTIYLSDSNLNIKYKIIKSITDSDNPPLICFDEINKPGISNLIKIISSINDIPISDIIKTFNNKSYSLLKKEAYNSIINKFSIIKKEYLNIRNNEVFLKNVLEKGYSKAEKVSIKILNNIKKLIGIL